MGTPTRLGRYEVLRPLARGGMAEILLGRSSGLGGFEKLVVLKRVRPELSHRPEYLRMFLDEARLAATLQHSNVVQVYDLGEDEAGLPFFAMEYLHGEDVRTIQRAARRRGERIPTEHAVAIAIGVAAGLHYAHTRVGGDGQPLGVVHRDVSPHNVYVTYDGGVKVVDFGIATMRNKLSETRSGTIKGKSQYMSPEQCAGEPLDARSDLFAISCVLWELTCGEPLFSGSSDFQIMRQIVDGELRAPSEVVRGYPRELERIVMRGLQRRSEDRFATAEELQLALEAFARDQKLAVSAVGLARYLRELFHGEVEAWSQAVHSGTHALESFALSRIAERAAEEEHDTIAIDRESVSRAQPKQTRVVARRSRRVRPAWLIAIGIGATLLAGIGWQLSRQHANHSIANGSNSSAATRAALAAPLRGTVDHPPVPSVGTIDHPSAPTAGTIDHLPAPPTLPAPSRVGDHPPVSDHPVVELAPVTVVPPRRASRPVTSRGRAPEHRAASHAPAHPADHPAPAAAPAIDLDAPLPPR